MNFDDLEKLTFNPNRVINALLAETESNLETDVVGTINGKGDPFSFALDTIVGYDHCFFNRLEDATSKMYKVHARSLADLSQHMSDEDWQDIFATPSKTTLCYMISVQEIKQKAVNYQVLDGDLVNSYKKLVIPKDTIFKVLDKDFWLEYGVEMRVMDHGGVQVVYDTTQKSPFGELGTNYPDRTFVQLKGEEYLLIYLPVKQVSIKEIPNKSSNNTVGFNYETTYNDNLYRIRAFIEPWDGGSRTEMTVIYKRTNYDPNYPTMAVDMLDNNGLSFTIPPVYLQNGLGIGKVTILLYTTVGALEKDLTTLNETYHKAEYFNYNNTRGELKGYELPFKNINNVYISSYTPITGGANGMNFDDIKNLIIYGHRRRDIPITEIDLTQKLKTAGYTNIKSIDFPNYRLYRVTKSIPVQDNKVYETEELVKFNSSLGTYVGSVLTSVNDIVDLGVANDNGERVTLLPGTVFNITKPSPGIVSKLETDRYLNKYTQQEKIDLVTTETLVSTPYYYVLDTSNKRSGMRVYYFSNPSVVEQVFFYENPYLGISLGMTTKGIGITNDGKNFVIDIVTKSSDEYKAIPDSAVGIQMAIDVDSDLKKTMKGVLVGRNSDKERLWRFTLPTKYDVNNNHELYLGGFKQKGELKDWVTTKLKQKVNFIFTFNGDSTKEKSLADKKIDQSLFGTTATAIVETEFTVEFGKYLNHLYTSIRPMVGAPKYKQYDKDIPSLYEEDVFQYENKELVIKDGKAVILHRKGEPILDSKGNPTYTHRKGETIKVNNEPVPLGEREILYYWDFIGFDFAYNLSQDDYDIEYRNKIRDLIANNIMDELETISSNKLERTDIIYKPRSTVGFTRVIIDEGQEIDIKNDLKFNISFYLTKEGFLNTNLKNSITSSTHQAINSILNRTTVSSSIIIKALKDLSLNEIIEVKVNMYSDDREVDVISNVDETNGFAVRKKLVQTGDNFLTVREDIDIAFKEHFKD